MLQIILVQSLDCLSSVDVTYGTWKRKQDFEKILVI